MSVKLVWCGDRPWEWIFKTQKDPKQKHTHKFKTVTQNMLFSDFHSPEVCDDGIQFWTVYDWQPGKRNKSESVYDSRSVGVKTTIIILLFHWSLTLWAAQGLLFPLWHGWLSLTVRINNTMRAQCERTGLGSPGRQVCLPPARHPCEEVKGQLRVKVRMDLMMVRGGCELALKIWGGLKSFVQIVSIKNVSRIGNEHQQGI